MITRVFGVTLFQVCARVCVCVCVCVCVYLCCVLETTRSVLGEKRMLAQWGYIQAEKYSYMMREQKEAQGNILFFPFL